MLSIESGGEGLRALLHRAVGLDEGALARLRPGAGWVDVFVTTPFGVLAARRVRGEATDEVLPARSLLEPANVSGGDLWPGALPPAEGFTLLDELPVAVVRQLSDAGRDLSRQFSGPAGPPASLLNQTVLTVSSDANSVDIPMRMIFACTALGLIPGFDAPLDVPRHMRVSHRGSWIRLDAPFGTVYHTRGLPLL